MGGSARRIVAGIAAVATACGIMLAGAAGAPEAAQAADMSGFRAGAIISDAVFFDENAMDASQVQGFLQSRVPSCRSGYTCLKDYRQDTFSRGADPMCGPYQGAQNERASDIIVKVGRACGINPQVLVVLLQKEQGLVTSTAPTARAYRSATGYGCPDTAACDEQFYGFYNQVYKAAWAFQRYSNPPGTGPGTAWGSRYTRYAKGTTVQVLYHPDASCGSSAVYISNQATSSLYYYTPYQPDRAALASSYGTGGSCSAYGNRNFYAYFTDWFGSTGYVVSGWIGDKYASIGGAGSVLGAPTGPERNVPNGGAAQEFQGGTIVSSPAGAFVVRGWVRDGYVRIGSSTGPLAFPLGDEYQVPGGAAQRFQGGMVYSSAAGAYAVRGWVGDRYDAAGGRGGTLGFPTGDEQAVPGGNVQAFQGGSVVSSALGPFIVRGSIGDRYRVLGGQGGSLGFPRGDEKVVAGGVVQDFQRGYLSTTSTGIAVVRGWVGDAYRALGGPAGKYGLPLADERQNADGTQQQQFRDGRVYASAVGAYGVRGSVGERYVRSGETTGVLGAPRTNEAAVKNGYAQRFAGGGIWNSPRGTFIVRGWIGDRYVALGAEASRLGMPLGEERTVGGDQVQEFEGGRIVVGPAGVAVVYP
ncbi:hypothetical protein DZG03_10315 [Clavibacter phaseoli]|nr:hypothetical protein DZG03_10315 [Clavibacter phaseoli]